MGRSAQSEKKRARLEGPTPLSWGLAAIVIAVLSALSWALIIALVMGLWAAF